MKVTHIHHKQQVENFYKLLEQKDLSNWMELWSAEAQNDFPYSNHSKTKHLKGKDAIKQYWLNALKKYARLSLTLKYIFNQDDTVMVLVQAEHLLKNSPKQYQELNIGLFEFTEEGCIQHYMEFFNPSPSSLNNNI